MQFTLTSPLDMHLHVRDAAMMQLVAPLSAHDFAAAVIMPNLVPPVDSLDHLQAYRQAITAATADYTFQPS
jgi:dihydroorotase